MFAWFISHQPTILFSQTKPAINNKPAVLFSQNKPAPAISHPPNEQAESCGTNSTGSSTSGENKRNNEVPIKTQNDNQTIKSATNKWEKTITRQPVLTSVGRKRLGYDHEAGCAMLALLLCRC
jgi:hypothetical protein